MFVNNFFQFDNNVEEYDNTLSAQNLQSVRELAIETNTDLSISQEEVILISAEPYHINLIQIF